MTVGDRIKVLRKELKLNQLNFGQKIGITESAVSNFESGRRNPSDQTITSICREFGVNKEWLLEGEEPMIVQDENLDKLITKMLTNENETARQLFKALAKLDEEDWKAVQRLIDKLKNT